MDSYQIIKYPLATEKAVRLMESENKLLFEIDLTAKKQEVRKAVEDLFKVKVISVNTFITQHGKKRAYVRLSNETPAIEVATQMGLM
ncbi:50S ribosomal protein L23 [Candidatus Woesearchaeota archaeon]|nr:50S ribosomal protein L23 [Candidatus Woesearchaeota archaeon]